MKICQFLQFLGQNPLKCTVASIILHKFHWLDTPIKHTLTSFSPLLLMRKRGERVVVWLESWRCEMYQENGRYWTTYSALSKRWIFRPACTKLKKPSNLQLGKKGPILQTPPSSRQHKNSWPLKKGEKGEEWKKGCILCSWRESFQQTTVLQRTWNGKKTAISVNRVCELQHKDQILRSILRRAYRNSCKNENKVIDTRAQVQGVWCTQEQPPSISQRFICLLQNWLPHSIVSKPSAQISI